MEWGIGLHLTQVNLNFQNPIGKSRMRLMQPKNFQIQNTSVIGHLTSDDSIGCIRLINIEIN